MKYLQALRTPDAIAAVVLGLFAATTFVQTLSIDDFGNTTAVGAALWPQVLAVLLGLLCLVYLVRSLRNPEVEPLRAKDLAGIVTKYSNPVVVFVMYAAFLAVLKLLGMLVGLVVFCFLAMTVLGTKSWRSALVHAAVSIASIGVLWLMFTYGLGRVFPIGTLTGLR